MIMKKVYTNKKIILLLTIAYIYVPVFIFLLGYIKWYFAIPTIVIIFYFLFKMYYAYQKENKNLYRVPITIGMILLLCLFIAIFCILLGIGGWYQQAGDWYKHNAILRDLSERNWPVYYMEKEHCMLTYYIGQYLVPSLVGKVTHSYRSAEIAMCVWGIIGIYLVFFNLLRIVQADSWKKQLITFLIFIFFSGALILAQSVLKSIYTDAMLSEGNRHWIIVNNIMLQYRSNLVMIRWVFPQCIVPWLIVELFLEYYKKCEYYVLLFIPSLLFGTFSFVSFLVLAIVSAINIIVKKKGKGIILKCFSLANILPTLSLGCILFFYFLGYIKVIKPDYLSFHVQSYGIKYIFVYFTFCFFMFGIYAICIFQEYRKNLIYYASIIMLCIVPLFKMGLYNDFVMCVSIPVLFILMIYLIQFLLKDNSNAGINIKKGIIIMCLFIGAWYPFCELRENILEKRPGNMSADGYVSMKYFTDRNDSEILDDLKYNYYTYDLETSTFYRIFARKKID